MSLFLFLINNREAIFIISKVIMWVYKIVRPSTLMIHYRGLKDLRFKLDSFILNINLCLNLIITKIIIIERTL